MGDTCPLVQAELASQETPRVGCRVLAVWEGQSWDTPPPRPQLQLAHPLLPPRSSSPPGFLRPSEQAGVKSASRPWLMLFSWPGIFFPQNILSLAPSHSSGLNSIATTSQSVLWSPHLFKTSSGHLYPLEPCFLLSICNYWSCLLNVFVSTHVVSVLPPKAAQEGRDLTWPCIADEALAPALSLAHSEWLINNS